MYVCMSRSIYLSIFNDIISSLSRFGVRCRRAPRAIFPAGPSQAGLTVTTNPLIYTLYLNTEILALHTLQIIIPSSLLYSAHSKIIIYLYSRREGGKGDT